MMRKIKYLFIPFLFMIAGSCANRHSGSLPVSPGDILDMLSAGNKEFLENIDLSNLDAGAFRRAKPGASFLIGCKLLDAGLEKQARLLLRNSFATESDPWKRESAYLLSDLFEAGDSGGEGMAFAEQFIAEYPQDLRAQAFFLSNLNKSGRDFELTVQFESLARSSRELLDAYPELLLLLAKSEKRLGRAEWADRLRELFLLFPAADVHREAWEYVCEEKDRMKAFSSRESALFQGKIFLLDKKYSAALKGYKAGERASLENPAVLREYGVLLSKNGLFSEGAKDLALLLPRLKGEALIIAEELRGRLLRHSGQTDMSIAALKQALRFAEGEVKAAADGSPDSSDRVLWFLLSTHIQKSSAETVRLLPEYLPKIKDPHYFSDLFENFSVLLVEKRAWDSIRQTYEAMKGFASPEDTSRYGFLLAAAMHRGLYRPPSSFPFSPYQILAETAENGDAYYRILAILAMGRTLDFPSGSAASPETIRSLSSSDHIVQGFLDFEMPGKGFAAARKDIESLDFSTITEVARTEIEGGRIKNGLRILHRPALRNKAEADRDVLEILFPLAFREEIEEVVKEQSLPPALFYGLVREESYFDASIRSSAGAVGLSQLMPGTARDVARRLGIKSPELTDPLTNLRLGGRYFHDLLKRFGSGAHALLAYNAGGTRVSRWKKQYHDLPDVLFVEAVPYAESREYIRKVLVSAVHYGYLYHNTGPAETVSRTFPDFFSR